MTLEEIARRLAFEIQTTPGRLNADVTGGYACDLLSYVMANAREGQLWLTIQGHPNIVAVASLVGLSGIVVVEGAKVEPATIEKANAEGIPIFRTLLTTYAVAGRLWELGVR
jgi:hypothetical protein